MKLLPKSQVHAQVNEQRRQQIDEGMILAKKVDALRQTLAELEEQQRKFSEGTKRELERETQELHEEIAELTKKRDLLVKITKHGTI